MNVKNYTVEESFVWHGQTDSEFIECVENLDSMVSYLQSINECVYYSENLYNQEILQDTQILDFYSPSENFSLHDEKELFLRSLSMMRVLEEDEEFDAQIGLRFYPLSKEGFSQTDQAHNLHLYLCCRKGILIKIKSYDGFSTFMKTCFPNIIFSEDIETGMRGITHFETVDVRKAIIHDLGVLNDEALEIYREYAPNTEKMCKVLGSKVLACSMDTSDHNQFLSFSFSYLHDNQDIQIKSVLCSPHTKLLRRDSNLRIYFSWKDSIVGKGEKVLVGHIGGHPY